MSRRRPRVVLIGVHGHGAVHLKGLIQCERDGLLDLVGLVDRRPALPGSGAEGREFDTDAARLLEQLRPDIAVICTPIDTHLELAETALNAGAHLLLEKPPVTSIADLDRLLAAAERADKHCQVGFQAFGSEVVDELLAKIRAGGLGEVERITMSGLWFRDEAYFRRAPWAGKRELDGVTVADGVLTNPFAHGVALALRLAGGQVRSIEVETYRANDIETDDTACARIKTDGAEVMVAATLCAEREEEPLIAVEGSAGGAMLWYTEDRLYYNSDDHEEEYERIGLRGSLIEDLIEHLDDDPATDVLRCPLRSTRAFTEVLEAIQLGPAPRPIPERYVRVTEDGRTVRGIEETVGIALESRKLFSELGFVPWAEPVTEGDPA